MKLKIAIACFTIILSFQHAYSQISKKDEGEKLFSFGLIADPQYVDAETAGNRFYRNSIVKLEDCVSELNNQDLEFTVALGDLIDRDYESYHKILPIFDRLNAPVHKVIGNHDFSVEEEFKRKIRKELNNNKGYYDFTIGDYIFIVSDGTDLSTFANKEGSKKYKEAKSKLEVLKDNGDNNAYSWNGGFSEKQLKWIERKLQEASKLNKKVLLFCHWPLLPENGTQLWDNQKVIGIIENYPCVVAWISGHHHEGGYLKKENIHFLTIAGMVESALLGSFGVMDVYEDKLILNGYGNQKDIVLDESDSADN